MAHAKNGNGSDDRRLSFLEKVFLEDRTRWRQNEARWDNLSVYMRHNEAKTNAMLAEIKRQGNRIESLLKQNYRRSEHGH